MIPEDRMYNSPVPQNGTVLEHLTTMTARTTMINNEVRVFKGGSWKDRDYWLDPAQRRYFPQEMATDYIGFRCAMSRVGSKTQAAKKS